jgi:hypothetical protein
MIGGFDPSCASAPRFPVAYESGGSRRTRTGLYSSSVSFVEHEVPVTLSFPRQRNASLQFDLRAATNLEEATNGGEQLKFIGVSTPANPASVAVTFVKLGTISLECNQVVEREPCRDEQQVIGLKSQGQLIIIKPFRLGEEASRVFRNTMKHLNRFALISRLRAGEGEIKSR